MVEVVIAKYKEDTAWTSGLTHPYVIYDKSDTPLPTSIPLPNVGREAHTFLYHIVETYGNLADITVFLQGKPEDHTSVGLDACISYINRLTGKEEFTPFLTYSYCDPDFACYPFIDRAEIFRDPIVTYSEDASEHNCLSIPQLIISGIVKVPTFAAGAQYVVPKANILARPLEFWKKLLELSKTNTYHDRDFRRLDPWAFERIWVLLYTDVPMNPDFLLESLSST